LRDELLKLLQTAAPDQAVAQMAVLSLLAAVLPEIAALADVAQSAPHHEPVLPHTISVLRWLAQVEAALEADARIDDPAVITVGTALANYAPQLSEHLRRREEGNVDGRTLLRLGALFHDVGKRETRTVEEGGRVRFIGHDQVGARLAARRLRRLTLSNKAISHVRRIVAYHMRPLLLAETGPADPSRRAVYRFFRDAGAAGLDVGLLALADHLATHDGPGDPARWQRLLSVVTTLFRHYFEQFTETVAPAPLLDGNELMAALQLKPGPEVGRLLRLIEEAQAAGEVASKEEAIDFARQRLEIGD
jgi:putative nucleotidyltransferase with HDIG domain